MCHLVGMDLFSGRTLMDPNHGDTNGPRGIPNTKTQINIIGLDIFSFLHVLDYLHDMLEDVLGEGFGLELLKERTKIVSCLFVGGLSNFTRCRPFDRIYRE